MYIYEDASARCVSKDKTEAAIGVNSLHLLWTLKQVNAYLVYFDAQQESEDGYIFLHLPGTAPLQRLRLIVSGVGLG